MFVIVFVLVNFPIDYMKLRRHVKSLNSDISCDVIINIASCNDSMHLNKCNKNILTELEMIKDRGVH